MSDLIYCYDARFNAAVQSREIHKEFDDRLTAHVREAYPKIRRFADSGAFLFSDEANAALKEFMADDGSDHYVEALDTNLAKAKKCLATLIECSKIDLRLKRDWWSRLV